MGVKNIRCKSLILLILLSNDSREYRFTVVGGEYIETKAILLAQIKVFEKRLIKKKHIRDRNLTTDVSLH